MLSHSSHFLLFLGIPFWFIVYICCKDYTSILLINDKILIEFLDYYIWWISLNYSHKWIIMIIFWCRWTWGSNIYYSYYTSWFFFWVNYSQYSDCSSSRLVAVSIHWVVPLDFIRPTRVETNVLTWKVWCCASCEYKLWLRVLCVRKFVLFSKLDSNLMRFCFSTSRCCKYVRWPKS